MNLPVVRPLLRRRYQRDLDAYRFQLPTLSDVDASIVDGLHRRGVHVTSLPALGLDRSEEMIAAARDLSDRYAVEARHRNADGDQHLIVPAEQTAKPVLFEWGLQARLSISSSAIWSFPLPMTGRRSSIRSRTDAKERRGCGIAIGKTVEC
ncbi:hypothetical protein GGQ80_001969 [Sphingomonas jinjuensis]|uniref:Uncharacterized protein n=1 Tax=Sphingomonas jinjuensis TaxID=535907 RepID=A0A840F8L6_9SPHN|nr:hypothetical protein [Sphingomonas jinjuensis]